MTLVYLGIGILILVGFIFHQVIDLRKHKRWSRADMARDLMFKKYLELANDPFMNRAKWKEWLPIFEYTDAVYAANNYYKVEVNSLAKMSRQWIDDLDQLSPAD